MLPLLPAAVVLPVVALASGPLRSSGGVVSARMIRHLVSPEDHRALEQLISHGFGRSPAREAPAAADTVPLDFPLAAPGVVAHAQVAARRIPVGGFMMKFSSDSSLLATKENKDEDGKISVWKLNARDPLLEGTTITDRYRDYDFVFTSDNHLLTEDDSGVFVESFDASWALGHICDIVKRNLTPDERSKYLPPGFDYKPTCRLSE